MLSFADRIETREQLRAVIDEPIPFIAEKTMQRLDGHCRTFLDKCRFVAIATADAAGNIDVSPKGDPEGFMRVLDDEHVAVPGPARQQPAGFHREHHSEPERWADLRGSRRQDDVAYQRQGDHW